MSERLRATRAYHIADERKSLAPTASPTGIFGGQSLDKSTQREMSSRFGHDFSQVRIHTDARAEESAEALGANAYTVGNDIAFAAGAYAPGTPEGERLLAHELTHVVQQDRFGPGQPSRMSDRADASEREAEAAADRATAGHAVQISAAPGAAVARDEKKDSDWKAWDDNPLWSFMTNDALSGANAIEQTHYQDLHNAEANAMDRQMQQDFFMKDYQERGGWVPGESSIEQDRNLWKAGVEVEAAEHMNDFETMGGAMQAEKSVAPWATRWSAPLETAGKIGRVLSPLGMYSDGMSMVQDWKEGNYADATADTLGFVSSTIGTAEAAGAGLTALGATGAGGALSSFAATANPVGAVAGSAAGGYALGKYGLGKANDYAKKHEIFGKGDDGEARDSTGAASDAGMWVKDHVGGTFGSILGGATSIVSSWGTAGYSGLHALGSGISSGAGWLWDHTFGGDVDVDQDALNQATASLEQTMDQRDMDDERARLYGEGNQVAHEEMPPLPAK